MATINSELVATVQKSVDGKAYKVVGLQHVPYASSAEVLSTILTTRRHRGQCFYVLNASVIEIWQFVAGFADGDLVKVFPQTSGSETLQQAFAASVTATDNPKINTGASFLDISSTTSEASTGGGIVRVAATGSVNGSGNAAMTIGNNIVNTTGSNFGLEVSATNAVLNTGIYTSGDFRGIEAFSAGTAVDAHGTGSGTAIVGNAANGLAALLAIAPSSGNTVTPIVQIGRNTSGTAANGIGGSIDVFLQNTNGATNISNQIISKWIDGVVASRSSEFSITGVDSGATGVLLQISGAGIFTLAKGLPNYANDGAAAAGTPAIPVNGLYRNGSVVQIRVS